MKAPHQDPLQEKMSFFEKLCREQGLPVTVQRRVILESLAGREDHPTADEVFEIVTPRLPGLSRTTVYRVLEKLVELGVIHKASHLGSAARYDPNTQRHHHLTCLSCHKVLDMEEEAVRQLAFPKGVLKGFEITDYSVHFQGYCSDCLKNRRKPGSPGRKMVKST
jgi:Fur family peroxide stress response transcriptional regulator